MSRLTTRACFALMTLLVQGCYHAQLNGSAAGTALNLYQLGPEQKLIKTTTSWDASFVRKRFGEERWTALNARQRLIWMGVFALPQKLPEDRDYLLEAEGGGDVDANRDLQLDEQPVNIQGVWHALLPGSEINRWNQKVSLLTEACYQILLDKYGRSITRQVPGTLDAELDELAKQLVQDINKDGVVSYADVLAWNHLTERHKYLGDPRHLDELVTAITLAFPQDQMTWVAQRVLASSAQAGIHSAHSGSYSRK